MKSLKGILSQISFFTIIPSVKADLDIVAEYSYISPILIGIITGVIDFISYFLLSFVIGSLAKYAIIIVVEIVRGFNHLDGLLDFGDAMMIRGDYEKRIKALKDVEVGSGGIGLGLVYLVLMLMAVSDLSNSSIYILLSLICAEVLSRALGILNLSILPPMDFSYLGKLFHRKLKNKYIWLIAQTIPFILGYSIILFIVLFILFYYLGKKLLRGSSGDLTGAIITLSFPIFLLSEEKYCFLYYLLHLL
ncbi:adenosylcobinamide-GDP ribazoletransferase [Acidianus sulfidivorans JP7]|uniref:Adenosylcobinamide-GDP ribazoletransferase n=1 Tax=Acidianus sulfidivorans JP7 TaxID=619593 RepID=A0A2U9IND1_9CREN|nr:adenosylcobinamide-GDP ribazoletransferase [Acidianus sulfidivorans]AWR97515.1 adenosylcobinamide-GDP ribazoletransferase [Acidianus sulfidivorans JP7]